MVQENGFEQAWEQHGWTVRSGYESRFDRFFVLASEAGIPPYRDTSNFHPSFKELFLILSINGGISLRFPTSVFCHAHKYHVLLCWGGNKARASDSLHSAV